MYPIWVEGIQINRFNLYDVLADLDGEGATIYYDPKINTLYLDGYTTKTSNYHLLNYLASGGGTNSVIAADCDVNIHIKSDSAITATNDSELEWNTGIAVRGKLKMTGDEKLTINVNSVSKNNASVGAIYAHSDIEFSGLELDATVGNADAFVRCIESASKVLVNDGAVLTLNSGSSSLYNSFGILGYSADIKCSIIIDNASVFANASPTAYSNQTATGLQADYIEIINGANVTAIGGYSKLESSGIHSSSDLVVDGSTVNASSIKTTEGNSYGLVASEKVFINNSSINSTAGESNKASHSIYAIKEIDILGNSEVTANGSIAKGMSSGIFCEGKYVNNTYEQGDININTSGFVTVTSSTTMGGAYSSGEGMSHSRGIFARGKLTITDSKVTATSGDTTTATSPGVAGSHGIEASLRGIEIKGASVINTQGGNASGHSVGLIASGGDIIIEDNSSVTSKAVQNGKSLWNSGISVASGNLIITTSGDVIAMAGDSTGSSNSPNSNGINVGGKIIIDGTTGGTVNATSGNSTGKSRGINCTDLEIINCLNLMAASGNSGTGDSAGIYASESILITDSEISATGGNSSNADSFGICANVEQSGKGTLRINNSKIYARSGSSPDDTVGIAAYNGFYVIGGEIEAYSGQNGKYTDGIFIQNVIEITDAKIYAQAFDASSSSRGICGSNNITIGGNSDITAIGGTASTSSSIGINASGRYDQILTIKDNAKVNAIGGEFIGANSFLNGSFGIWSNAYLRLSTSEELFATGSKSSASSAGLWSLFGDIEVSNGFIHCTGDTANSGYSYGLYSNNGNPSNFGNLGGSLNSNGSGLFVMTGGIVEAYGKTASINKAPTSALPTNYAAKIGETKESSVWNYNRTTILTTSTYNVSNRTDYALIAPSSTLIGNLTLSAKVGELYDGFSDGVTNISILKNRHFTIQSVFESGYSNISFIIDKELPIGTKLILLDLTQGHTWTAFSKELSEAVNTISIADFTAMDGTNAKPATDASKFLLCVDLTDTGTSADSYSFSVKDNSNEYSDGEIKVNLVDFASVKADADEKNNKINLSVDISDLRENAQNSSLVLDLLDENGNNIINFIGVSVTFGDKSVELFNNRAIIDGVINGKNEIVISGLSAGEYKIRLSLAQETEPQHPMQEVVATAIIDNINVSSGKAAIKAELTDGERLLPNTGGTVKFDVDTLNSDSVSFVLQKKNGNGFDYEDIGFSGENDNLNSISVSIPANDSQEGKAQTYRVLFYCGEYENPSAIYPYNIIVSN